MTSRHWLAAAALCAAGIAQAQPITLYEHENFNGRRISSEGSVPSLQNGGFNDQASSLIVRSGRWQLCSDAFYRGECTTFGPGEYASLRAVGMNDKISSVREVGWRPAPPGTPPPPPARPTGPAIVMYSDPGFGGRAFPLNDSNDNFANAGFNDRARSAEVNYGTWILCSDARFQGRCQEMRPGRYPDLGAMSGQVSSARMVETPVAAPPPVVARPPAGGWGTRTRVVLYEGPRFQGRAFEVDNNYISDLKNSGFNDRSASVRVERGYWIFCTDANFQGECRTLGPGDYAALPYGLVNRVSSLRRISEDYPYNTPPSYR